MAIRLEILGHVIIGSAAFFTVLQAESMDASAVGLSISYAMGVGASVFFLPFSVLNSGVEWKYAYNSLSYTSSCHEALHSNKK